MDGVFVPQLTYGQVVVEAVRRAATVPPPSVIAPAATTPATVARIAAWQQQARVRQQIDQLDIATADALAHYTGLNNALMALVGELAQLTEEGGIARQLAVYYNLLEAKDLAGIERALLSNIFAADAMPPATQHRLLSLVGEERAFLESVHVLSDDAQREALSAALSGPEIERVLARRELALQQNGDYNVNPEEWFDWQTVKIGRLKALEDQVAAAIVEETAGRKGSAQQALWQYMAVAVLASLGGFVGLKAAGAGAGGKPARAGAGTPALSLYCRQQP